MQKLLAVILLGAGYYYYDNYLSQDRVYDVANNPIPTYDYIELWQQKAVDSCIDRATDYHIDVEACPTYISSKFGECHLELPTILPNVIDSQLLGQQVIASYYRCISPHPHCDGNEITSDTAYQTYCVSS